MKSNQPEETYEKFLLPELPEGYDRKEETFDRDKFESDPLGWVDENRGF